MDFFKILNGGIGVSMSNFDRLWAKKFSGWPETELTGLLPLTFLAEGSDLTDYRIYGTENGAGVQTENLFNVSDFISNYVAGYVKDANGNIVGSLEASSGYSTYTIPVNQSQIYYLRGKTRPSSSSFGGFRVYFLDSNLGWIDRTANIDQFDETNVYEFTTPANTSYLQIQTPVVIAVPDMRLMITSTAPTTYIPYGYKIPILNTSGVTENKIDISMFTLGYTLDQTTGLPTASQNQAATLTPIAISSSNAVIKCSYSGEGTFIFMYSVLNGNTLVRRTYSTDNPYLIDTSGGDTLYICVFVVEGTSVDLSKISNLMLTFGSTPPDHYIPHRYTSNYDLFIGDSKLGEDEYVDYGEQKIYKDVSGTLTPTNPPVPFPAISTYQGENALSSEETVGEVTIKGKIREAP